MNAIDEIVEEVRCKSGLMGSRQRLQERYSNIDDFRHYAEMYSLHSRLGYKSVESAWRHNPVVESSVNPSDYRKVRIR